MSSQLLNSWGVSTTLRLGETREISETPFSRVPPPFGWLDCPGRSATTPRGAPGLPPAPAPLRALPGFRGTRKPALDSYWNAPAHGNKFRLKEATIPDSFPKPMENTHVREEPCGTAVSKLHGRAPNPRARQRGGRAPVEVGDFPFLESIFVIFGNVSGLSPDFIPKTAISRRNDQRLPKSPPKTLTKYRNGAEATCRQPPRARGPPPAESGVLARPRKFGVVTQIYELLA